MHPTAIWAMRPYCVDAGTLATMKKTKQKPIKKRIDKFELKWTAKQKYLEKEN